MSQDYPQERKDRDLFIRQSNALTSAAYSLTRNEKRLIYMAIMALNQGSTRRGTYNEVEVDINHSDYESLFDEENNNTSRDIRNITQSLMKKEVVFFVPDEDGEEGEKALDGISWLTMRSYRPKRGMTTLFFNPRLMDIITQNQREFTKIILMQAGKLNSPYAMRLYESLMQWSAKGSVVFHISWLCERYNLPASYQSRMPDFRRRFLIPSVEEINRQTELNITYREIPDPKNKRKPKSIAFTIQSKSNRKQKLNKLDDVDPKSLKAAVITYSDINSLSRVPSMEELDNFKLHLMDMIIEGFAVDKEFMAKFEQIQQESQAIEGPDVSDV
ncbi:hypothetical protein PSSHI_45010 [Photobacterium sp. R1]